MTILGKRLKQARKNKGLTQDYVAKIIGTTYQTISNYERGTRDPDTESLTRLANLYETSIDYLLGRTDDPTPSPAKKKEPSHEEYVLSAKTLGDSLIMVAELVITKVIDNVEAMYLSGLVFKKFRAMPAVDAEPAAWSTVDIPGAGALYNEDD